MIPRRKPPRLRVQLGRIGAPAACSILRAAGAFLFDGAQIDHNAEEEDGEQVERSRKAATVELIGTHVRLLPQQLPDAVLVPHSFFTEASASMICACIVV